VALKPQDVLVLVKWALRPKEAWTVRALAAAVGLSPSETLGAIRRLTEARLLGRVGDDTERLSPLRQNVVEFLLHGLKYAFPARRGSLTRGVPTAHAAPVLRKRLPLQRGAAVPVWPDAQGKVRGESLTPLYRSAVRAAAKDDGVYAALALIDAIRAGSARERALAGGLLEQMIMGA
jgi:hypothetical protein